MSVLKKVKSGDPLVIPASTFNAFIDAARAHQGTQQAIGAQGLRSLDLAGTVKVQNDSGVDVGRFGVLGIDAPVIGPGDNLREFQSQLVLSGVTPADGTHNGKFAVLLDPINAGSIGLACVSGLCVAKVDVTDEGHGYADIGDGVDAHLVSGDSGAAVILWKESGTGEKWAVVRIGGGGSAGDTGGGGSGTGSQWMYWETQVSDYPGADISMYPYGGGYMPWFPLPCDTSVVKVKAWLSETITSGQVALTLKTVAPGSPCPDPATAAESETVLALDASANAAVADVSGVFESGCGLLGVTAHTTSDYSADGATLMVLLKLEGPGYPGGGAGGPAPQTARIFFEAAKAVTGTWTRFVYNTSQPYQMGMYCSSQNVGDRIKVGFDLAAGEYELNVIGIEDADDRCEVEWFIDGVSVWANDDWRAGGGYDTLHSRTGIAVSGDGYHTLEVKVTAVGSAHGWAAFTTAWFVPNNGAW